MKTLRLILLPVLLLALGFSNAVNGSTVQADDYEPVTLDGRLKMAIPSELQSLNIPTPHAQVLVEVDEKGNVIDAMPIKASHFGLLPSAIKLIEKTTFTPARLKGTPVKGKAAVYVNFFDEQQLSWKSGTGVLPFGGSVSDAVQSRFYQNAPTRFMYRESEHKELDSPLRITESKIRIYKSEEGVETPGTCLVEYYIGPEGDVHFPKIIKSDHDDISTSALLTLEVTKFEPPLRNGRPTCVKIRQPFNFN